VDFFKSGSTIRQNLYLDWDLACLPKRLGLGGNHAHQFGPGFDK
jgi:hypothetical protein